MGDGKNLKELLQKQGKTVKELSKATGIKTTTLYSIIQKDSNIRFDYGLRIANELNVDVNEICLYSPFSGDLTEDEIYMTVKDPTGILDASRVKTYLLYSMYPLMKLYGKNAMPDLDHICTSFYQLDDEGRKAVVDIIETMLKIHKDPKRAADVRNIKGW